MVPRFRFRSAPQLRPIWVILKASVCGAVRASPAEPLPASNSEVVTTYCGWDLRSSWMSFCTFTIRRRWADASRPISPNALVSGGSNDSIFSKMSTIAVGVVAGLVQILKAEHIGFGFKSTIESQERHREPMPAPCRAPTPAQPPRKIRGIVASCATCARVACRVPCAAAICRDSSDHRARPIVGLVLAAVRIRPVLTKKNRRANYSPDFPGGWAGVWRRQSAGIGLPDDVPWLSMWDLNPKPICSAFNILQTGYDPNGMVDIFEKIES